MSDVGWNDTCIIGGMDRSTGKPPVFFSKLSGPLGWISGWLVAPWFAVVSFARAARTFHPRGDTVHATVRRHPATPAARRDLADGLTGHALVRFSAALWKRAEYIPDVLGCAIRLRDTESDDARPEERDQDLLFATIRRPWSMAVAPLTTHVRDYMRNDYYGVAPFAIGAERPIYLRVRPQRAWIERPGKRSERLARAVRRGTCLQLESSPKPFGPWEPLVEIALERPANIDDDQLRFSPFRAGRGVHPHGFIQSMRRGAYAASQRARAARSAG